MRIALKVDTVINICMSFCTLTVQI